MSRNHEDRVTLVGTLGGDPETKPTANGQMLTLNLGVQVISVASDEAGQRQSSEKTSWHCVISFDPRVIRRAHRLEKDDIIAVRGYLDQRAYEKDGQRLFIAEVVAEELDPIRAKCVPSVVPPPFPDARTSQHADMLRITVELLPGGRESGAMVISCGTLPITNLADLARAIGGFGA